MNVERKPSITELIEALELHLSPHTDPDHCDPCPYNPVGDGALDVPQNLCIYKLMHDCLDTLKKIVKQVDEHYWVKDFIEYALRCDLPNVFLGTDDDFKSVRFAFLLGAAFQSYKQQWEE